MAPRFTREGLPVILDGIVEVFFRDSSVRNNESMESQRMFNMAIATKIKSDNPELTQFFQTLYDLFPEEQANQMAFGAGCMYEVIRRQAEANEWADWFENIFQGEYLVNKMQCE